MALMGQTDMASAGSPQVWMAAMSVMLMCIIMYIFHVHSSRSVLINDSMIIRDSMSLGGKGMVHVSAKWL